MLTQETLKAKLHYDPETGLFHWLNSGRGHDLTKPAGYTDARGYVWIRIDEKLLLAHRLAWLYMTGEWPTAMLDHRDQKKTNNKFANLRQANKSDNAINSQLRSDNTSGVKGVSWHSLRGKWLARIKRGHIYTSKIFVNFDDAVAWYNMMAEELHGEFRSPDQTENDLSSTEIL